MSMELPRIKQMTTDVKDDLTFGETMVCSYDNGNMSVSLTLCLRILPDHKSKLERATTILEEAARGWGSKDEACTATTRHRRRTCM
jgi:hypothetical protein